MRLFILAGYFSLFYRVIRFLVKTMSDKNWCYLDYKLPRPALGKIILLEATEQKMLFRNLNMEAVDVLIFLGLPSCDTSVNIWSNPEMVVLVLSEALITEGPSVLRVEDNWLQGQQGRGTPVQSLQAHPQWHIVFRVPGGQETYTHGVNWMS